jgi:phage-related protein
MEEELKPVRWVGSSYRDLKSLPLAVRRAIGFALDQAQRGGKHPDAKPLKGFGGAGVLEVVEQYSGDTYRVVYTVKLVGVIYVLHVFQKKSKSGIGTPKQEIDLITSRLRDAELDYKEWKQTGLKERRK